MIGELAALETNLKSGIRWGARYAVAYSAIALLILLLRGQAAFAEADTTFLRVLLFYWAGGLTGGVLVGLLWPLGRSRVGAALLGAIVGVPVGCMAMLVVTPPSRWHESVVVAAVLGLILGPFFGLASRLEM